jgi:hypothetical protein
MNRARSFVIAVGFFVLGLGVALASAQDLSRYRVYALDSSSLGDVASASGARAADAKTLHTRPATIHELEWRAPYVSSGTSPADPVREIVFRFYNDALYQIVVSYDRDRTEGLTNADIIESISATYGIPAPLSAAIRANPPPEAFPDSIVLARWQNGESTLTLVRGTYAVEFQLILTSKRLATQAGSAIREAARLDAIDAPRREADQRRKDASDATDTRDRRRTANKAAFRP